MSAEILSTASCGRWLLPRVLQCSAISAVGWRPDLRRTTNIQPLWRQNFCSCWTSFVELSTGPVHNLDITDGLFRRQLKGHHGHGTLWLSICTAFKNIYLLTCSYFISSTGCQPKCRIRTTPSPIIFTRGDSDWLLFLFQIEGIHERIQIYWRWRSYMRKKRPSGRAKSTILLQWNSSFGETRDQVHFSCRRLCWKVTKYDIRTLSLSLSLYELFERSSYLHWLMTDRWMDRETHDASVYCTSIASHTRTRTCTHTQSFNGLFSRTTRVGQYQKDKPFWILLKQEVMGWQWHQLNHIQIICTSLQTDNHASTSSLHIFLQAGCPSCRPTNSVKAMKAIA